MTKPDWKDAPEWANVLLQHFSFGDRFVWAESYDENARSYHCKFKNETKLALAYWNIVEHRPQATAINWNEPPPGTVCEYSLNKENWWPCQIIGYGRWHDGKVYGVLMTTHLGSTLQVDQFLDFEEDGVVYFRPKEDKRTNVVEIIYEQWIDFDGDIEEFFGLLYEQGKLTLE